MEPCAECGYSYGALRRPELAPRLRDLARRYGDILGGDGGRLRNHPRADVWSALEYACHVRDVLAVQRERILQACLENEPDFLPMRRDERVLEERYNAQEPAAVSRQVVSAADSLARTLEGLDEVGWDCTGVYHWPTTEIRTVDWIGRHTVHELVHHLQDMTLLLQTT